MGQDKPDEQPPPPPPTFWEQATTRFKNTAGSGLAFAVIPLIVLGYFGWYYYGAEHLDRTLYSLKIENIELTDKPSWITSDVKSQVFRDNGLSKLSLLEPQATATIAHAFDAHYWIKSTNRVRKSAGGKVIVDVTYRRPMAMVFYKPQNETAAKNKNGFCFPVDEEGVVLPGEDFTPAQVHNYFMIDAPDAAPAGKGVPFGDPRITEALPLCRLLEPWRVSLKLKWITVEPDAIDHQLGVFNSWIMRIVTEDNREIVWGHAPNKENKDEMNIQEKIASLRAWLSVPAESSDIAVLDLRVRRILPQRLITSPRP